MLSQEKSYKLFARLPSSPGVYFLYDRYGHLLYIGKAHDLKKRIKQHFERPYDARIEQMLQRVSRVKVQKTTSNIEALILESELIYALKPKYNVKLRDDKTFLGVYITDEPFPRVFPARITHKRLPRGQFYGPYTSAKTLRQALKIIRKIFPYCADPRRAKPCLYYYLKQCPGPCAGVISHRAYRRIIGNLKLFLRGRRTDLIKKLKTQMRLLALQQRYEGAALARNTLRALEHIRDVNLAFSDEFTKQSESWYHATHHYTKPIRVAIQAEGYDVSNVFGKSAVGVMVVGRFEQKNLTLENWEYRQFKIKQVTGVDDVAMMAEVVSRRLNHLEWPLPELMVIDGGRGHYNAVAKIVMSKVAKEDTPMLVAAAKGPTRKKLDLYFNEQNVGSWLRSLPTLKTISGKMVAEAHRFAIKHHRKLHRAALLP